MTGAWARVVPMLAAHWEPQGQDQHQLPLIFQPVFTAESPGGSPTPVSAQGLPS